MQGFALGLVVTATSTTRAEYLNLYENSERIELNARRLTRRQLGERKDHLRQEKKALKRIARFAALFAKGHCRPDNVAGALVKLMMFGFRRRACACEMPLQ